MNKNLFFAICSGIILVLFYIRFEAFFPNNNGLLGHDYGLFLPHLLDGTFWYKVNGIFDVPWFTPSFGGGLPKFPNPQAMYYSIPQFLCFFVNPLTSVKVTIFLFAILGFLGFYLLLNKLFLLDRYIALFGASVFLFNGFYIHRMIVGHLTYHSFMLFPMLIFFGLKSNASTRTFIRDIMIGGCMLAYMFYSGAIHLIPMLGLSMALVYFILQLYQDPTQPNRWGFYKMIWIFLLGACLSAAYINASLSYLSHVPRDFYPLPGFNQIQSLLYICLKSLFYTPPQGFANSLYTNNTTHLMLHEYEYSITLVPLLLIFLGLYYLRTNKKIKAQFIQKNVYKLLLLIALMSLPILLNFYTPTLNFVLKNLPFFRNSSTLIRWFSVYIPIVILFASISLANIPFFNKQKTIYILMLIALSIFISDLQMEKAYYHTESYNPRHILSYYEKTQANNFTPSISKIDTIGFDDHQKISKNDVFVLGISQLKPDEPMFGYQLEEFPTKSLHIGNVFSVNNEGLLNLKNPSSYVFPEENQLEIGEHFKTTQLQEAIKFTNYTPYAFNQSTRQVFANYITIFSLLFIFITVTSSHLLTQKSKD